MIRRLALLALFLVLAACAGDDDRNPFAPVGGIVVESETLGRSSSGSTLCVVRGTFFNMNGFSVDTTLRWRAFDAAGTQIGVALDLQFGIAPRTRASFESTIFDIGVTCPRIARFERFETTARRS